LLKHNKSLSVAQAIVSSDSTNRYAAIQQRRPDASTGLGTICSSYGLLGR
jgi:CobQ-like glutamine amidotransferase family enzyme